MKQTADNFRLGLAVIVMFTLFVACLLFIGAKGLQRTPMRELTIRMTAGPAMPDVGSGSLVTCFGQSVGKVKATKLVVAEDPNDTTVKDVQYLEIHAEVRRDLDLRADCILVASGPPLGGKGLLEITNRGVSKQELPDDQVLYASASGLQTALAQLTAEFDANDPNSLIAQIKRQLQPDLDDSLVAKIHVSLDHIATLTARLSSQFDPEEQDVLLAKIHTALDQVNHTLSEVVGITEDARPRVDQALGSAEHALSQIDKAIVAPLSAEFDRSSAGSLLAQIHEAMQRLNSSLGDTNTITGETRRTIVLNTARIDQLVQNATEASILLKRGVRDLAMQPWRLLNKPTEREQAQLQDIDVAREFADAAARLDDAAVRLKALSDAEGTALTADSPELQRIREELSKSVDEFFSAESELRKRLRDKE